MTSCWCLVELAVTFINGMKRVAVKMRDNHKRKRYGQNIKIIQTKRSKPGIEPGTSATRRQNHTPRPLGHNKCYMGDLNI